MKCNVGGADRSARLVIGVGLLLIGIFVPMAAVWRGVVFAVAVVALITAIIRYCPANALVGVNTCREKLGPP